MLLYLPAAMAARLRLREMVKRRGRAMSAGPSGGVVCVRERGVGEVCARESYSLDCPPQYQTSPNVTFTRVAVTCSVAHVAVAATV
jgi:hypothetical protein